MRIVIGILAAIALAVVVKLSFANSGETGPAQPERLKVAATIFPLAHWLQQVGGDDVEVQCIVGGTASPHHFEYTVKDAMRVGEARALFAIGLRLDPWAAQLARNTGERLAYFETGTWITPRRFSTETSGTKLETHPVAAEKNGFPQFNGFEDPHYWLDPARAVIVVQRMADELARLDPAHRDNYLRRAKEYVAKLNVLNLEIEQTAAKLGRGRELVTFHNAYGYLFERLGIHLSGVIQSSPGVEPSARDITESVEIMRRIGQRVVFSEPQESLQAASLVAQDTGGTVAILDPMDSEFSETGKSYIDRLRYDLQILSDTFLGREAAKK